jgi:uncharacterized protein
MDIDIEELGESGASFDHIYEADELNLGDEQSRLLEGPEVHVQAVRDGDQFRIQGSMHARVEVDCDRCLKSVEVVLNPNIDVTYAPIRMIGDESAHEIADNELDYSFFEGNLISVDGLVREQIFLALPSRLLCTDECKGLCPECGADRNRIENCGCQETQIDPRWSALKNLN